MANYIVYNKKTNLFNVFSTIVDNFCWESGLTETQLRDWYIEDAKAKAEEEFNRRSLLAKEKGTSSKIHSSLEECISHNYAGKDNTCLNYEECLDIFLSPEK